ncbi:MAG: DUF294 nucleotidyltransferase-like domain-containing protein, partial [Ignavibacteria bacterium]|nr:DUF294 nucleotidyltransferase-like domain-containing protein [Ignavibacteria bacterium]
MFKRELKNFVSDFLSKRFQITEKNFFESIEYIIEEIFPTERVLRNLKRIFENDYYLPIYLETPEDFLKYFEVILKISAFSNYLTDVMVRNPEFLTRFLSSGELHKDFSIHDFTNELNQQISIYKSFEKKIDALRRFKRLHILRIGLRDILNLCELEQTMLEYSLLTNSILEKAFQLSFEINQSKIERKKIPSYALISLGKLGGLELNFSSDVDLICLYNNPDEKYSSEVLEFYDKVVKDFIKICTDTKDGSPLYRIDFRLRPDGKYSPLARSISYYQIYYETYGRDWERQMLLKMNFVCGDKNLYDKFYRSIENFIFPRSSIIPPQVFIRRFRKIYLEKFSEENSSAVLNLKHFSGGIRDVEFSVQALQLIYGGRFNQLRSSNTINVIKTLSELNLIENNLALSLTNAYKFLRRIENYIQLMDDRQLHTLPQDKDKLENLVKYLELKSKKEFDLKLNTTRKIVREFYEKVFGQEEKIYQLKFHSSKIYDKESFEKKFQKLINLIEEKSLNHLVTTQSEAISDFQERLIKALKQSENPERLITHFIKFISNLNTSFQILELIQNKKLFTLIAKVFEHSEPLTNSILGDKKIIDFIFSGTIFDLKNSYSPRRINEEEIKRFVFQLMLNFFTGNLKTNQVSEEITKFIDQILISIIQKKSYEFDLSDKEFAVLGMGSYGNFEMHFKSDVDVLFIFHNQVDENTSEKFSLNILSEFRNIFKLFDYFQIDSKLRPEGTISKLSWSISEIEKYIHQRMRIWEFQAYTKMRLIYGSEELFDSLVKLLQNQIRNFSFQTIAMEIKKNRQNIKSSKISFEQNSIDLKNSSGALMDLQFLLQYKILINSFNEKFIGKNFKATIEQLSKSDKIL